MERMKEGNKKLNENKSRKKSIYFGDNSSSIEGVITTNLSIIYDEICEFST